jgi:hypothetical protein
MFERCQVVDFDRQITERTVTWVLHGVRLAA